VSFGSENKNLTKRPLVLKLEKFSGQIMKLLVLSANPSFLFRKTRDSKQQLQKR